MISLTLLGRDLKENYKILLIFILVLALYASMIIAMFDPHLGEGLKQMAESMPGIFEAFGMVETGATMAEFMANYLYGFLFIVFPLVFILLLAGKLVVRFISRGSMAFLLSTPNRRSKLIVTQIVFFVLMILLLMAIVCGLCVLFSENLFPGELDIPSFLWLNGGLLGLLLCLGAMCFFFSCAFNDSRKAMGISTALVVAFVLLQMVSQVGEKFSQLKNATPLTLFDTSALLAQDMDLLWKAGCLYGAAILLFVAGAVIFCKKDIPV